MQNSNVTELIYKFSEKIAVLSEFIAIEHETIVDKIELLEEYEIDFRHTFKLDKYDFYINIDELYQQTKNIKKYAIGLVDNQTKSNKLLFDNEEHHNNVKVVKEINPPHHQHLGTNEMLKGSDGQVDTIVESFKKRLENFS